MRKIEGKTAYLYGRVSTTDQKDNGYSLSQQKKFLYDFCERNGIVVLDYFEEDYTSTTFERPKYKELINQLKKFKADYILFHKWDRFSREPDGIAEVERLLKLNIKPNSISEWIDFSDAGYYLYLGIYILQAKVENKKRSERVKDGIIGALSEGRHINNAPIGYKNARDSNNPNKPLIVPCPEKSKLIKMIFEEFATGNYKQEFLRLKYYKLGIKIGRSQFSALLSNIRYIGKIIVPAHKSFLEKIVQGLHEPIIDEALFYKVQAIKNNRIPRVNIKSKSEIDEVLPLRGGILKYVNDDIDKSSYDRLKGRYNDELTELSIGLSNTSDQSNGKFIDFGMQLLLNLDIFYKNAGSEIKRQIIRSIFIDKLVFENKKYRTPKMTEAVALIFSYNNGLKKFEKKKEGTFKSSSSSVPITEEISKHLVEDLERILEINNPVM